MLFSSILWFIHRGKSRNLALFLYSCDSLSNLSSSFIFKFHSIQILRFWKPSYDSLRSVLKLSSRNFPTNLSLDHNTLGYVLL